MKRLTSAILSLLGLFSPLLAQWHKPDAGKTSEHWYPLHTDYHMSLGCYNSWGALPSEVYQLPYGAYTLSLRVTPIHLGND